MKVFRCYLLIILVSFLTTNVSFAESLKERLRMAREKEALTSQKPQEIVVEEPKPKQENADCPQDGQNIEGTMYYFECFCKDIKYPKIEAVLKPHGMHYESLGIKELGTGITHFDPKERVKNRYTCGTMLKWDVDNVLKFNSVNACYDFVKSVVREVKSSVEVVSNPLYYGCGQHVQRAVKK